MRFGRDLFQALDQAKELPETLKLCLEAALRISGMRCGAIYLAGPEGDLRLTQGAGLSARFLKEASFYSAGSVHTQLVMKGEPLFTQHAALPVPISKLKSKEGLRALAMIPIRHHGTVVGCLNVASRTQETIPAEVRLGLESLASALGFIVSRGQVEQQLRKRQAWLHALAARLQAIQEEGRTRLAREVHDVMGQLLTGLTLDLGWLEKQVVKLDKSGLREAMQAKLHDMGQLCEGMIHSVQELASELRPSVLDNLGLASAIRFESDRFQKRSSLTCLLDVPATIPPLNPECATSVFRIYQEILTNIARHAHAHTVQTRLAVAESNLHLEVKDDGVGLSPDRVEDPRSLGLLGMRERAEQLGGRIRFSGAGGGTAVSVVVPLHMPESESQSARANLAGVPPTSSI